MTNTAKAGITFPVGRIRRYMQEGKYAKIIRIGSAVYLAAALEYLVAEVLELSGTVARQNKRQRIIPRHVMMAVRSDSELDKLFKNVTIANGGVVPLIHSVLLPKTKQPSSQKIDSEEMWKKPPEKNAQAALPCKNFIFLINIELKSWKALTFL